MDGDGTLCLTRRATTSTRTPSTSSRCSPLSTPLASSSSSLLPGAGQRVGGKLPLLPTRSSTTKPADRDVRADLELAVMGFKVLTGAGDDSMNDSATVMFFVDVALMTMHCSAVASCSRPGMADDAMRGGSAGGGDLAITAAGSVLGGALLLNWDALPMTRDGAVITGAVGRRDADAADLVIASWADAAATDFVTSGHAGL